MNFIKLSKLTPKAVKDKFNKGRVANLESSLKFQCKKVLNEAFLQKAKEIKIEKIERKTLFLSLKSSSLNQKIYWKKQEIIEEVNNYFGQDLILEIRARLS